MRVVIEPMQADDISAVLSITTDAARRSAPSSHARTETREHDAKLTDAKLHEELARAWARIWVARAEVGGSMHVVGFLLAWHVADELHILDVVAHAEMRRRGIGRALMDRAISYAKDARCAHLLLEVRRSNPAIHLYRACGFSAMGLRPRYYADNEDAVEMVLIFDPATGDIVTRKDEVSV